MDALSIDRLSDLPDAILCHILSFLPTRTSIKTSVLSTRWRFVWKFVPNLYFDGENQDFINRVLSLHKLPSIDTLSLESDGNSCSDYLMETWITAALARNVRNLEFCHYFEKDLQFPLHLLTCQTTLVDLRLDCSCVIPTANTVWLPRLKKLNLSRVKFENNESLPCLLSGCPVLEYLLLTLQIDDHDLVDISSPTLKRLEVDLDYSPDQRLKIDTPALEYLDISDCWSEHFESVMMASLTEANVVLHNYLSKVDDLVYSESVVQFVNSLCSVKRLRLDFKDSTEIIDCVATASFHNLTELDLTVDGFFLSEFLENADNIEVLIFCEVCYDGRRTWVEPEQVPTCLSSTLRFVEMRVDKSSDFEIVRYLLRNARILERIKITHYASSEDKNRLIQEISQIERGSEACELVFV